MHDAPVCKASLYPDHWMANHWNVKFTEFASEDGKVNSIRGGIEILSVFERNSSAEYEPFGIAQS